MADNQKQVVQWFPGHMAKTRRLIKESLSLVDGVTEIIDARIPYSSSNPELEELTNGKPRIVLLNKSDLDSVTDEDVLRNAFKLYTSEEDVSNICRVIKTSTKENTGIDLFEDTIKEMFFDGNISMEDEIYITSLRQKEQLYETKKSLELVKQSLFDEMPEDFYSIDLMNAYTSLGLIIGEEVEDDLADEIFSKFCMGK